MAECKKEKPRRLRNQLITLHHYFVVSVNILTPVCIHPSFLGSMTLWCVLTLCTTFGALILIKTCVWISQSFRDLVRSKKTKVACTHANIHAVFILIRYAWSSLKSFLLPAYLYILTLNTQFLHTLIQLYSSSASLLHFTSLQHHCFLYPCCIVQQWCLPQDI